MTIAPSTTTPRRRLPPAKDGDRGMTRAQRAARTSELLAEARACAEGGNRAQLLDEVIVINRGVAESVAARYRDRGIDLDDLKQVACLGLTRAVRRFDGARSEDLLTYAVPTIRGELQRHFRDHGWAIRPVRRIQELQWRVNQTIERLAQELGREPTEAEIRAEHDLTSGEYAEVVRAFGCFQPTSLDQPAGPDADTTLGALIGEHQSVSAVEARTVLEPVLRRLSERDRRILYLRFYEDQTQSEIGDVLGVTQMQVSRLLKRILGTMRDSVDDAEAQ